MDPSRWASRPFLWHPWDVGLRRTSWILTLGVIVGASWCAGCFDLAGYTFGADSGGGANGGSGGDGDSGTGGAASGGGSTASGAGGDGGGGGPTGPVPELVVDDADNPVRIAVDDTHVYWTTNGGGSCRPKVRRRVKSLDQPVEVMVEANFITWDIGVTDTEILFGTRTAPVGVFGCSKSSPCDLCNGGESAALRSGTASPSILQWTVFDDTHFYFAGATLYRCPLAGCTGTPETSAVDTSGWGPVGQDADAIYWGDSNGVRRCTKEPFCPAEETVVETPIDLGIDAFTGVKVHDGYVYWGDSSGVFRCSVSGCSTPITLIDVTQFPLDGGARRLAVDETGVYVATSERLLRCPLTNCDSNPEVMATGIVRPQSSSMLVDATHVYWGAQNAQQIWRMAK